MAQLLIHAEPGQVITAQDWNLVVDAVNELLQSGQTNGIKINAMLPSGTADQPLKIGALVQIAGQNFGFSIGQAKVTFESGSIKVTVVRASMLEGSSDEALLFLMPAIPTITSAGMMMTMRANNGVAEDSRAVFVKPIVISLTGDVFVNWRADAPPNPSPNPLQSGPGKPADFHYRLQTSTNMPGTFDLSVDILNATVAVPPGLVNSIEFRDDANNNTVISSKQIELGKNETRNITVHVPEFPSNFSDQSFALKVVATSGKVVGSDQRTFTVGAKVDPLDPNIDVTQGTPVVFNTSNGSVDSDKNNGRIDGSTIKLKPNRQMLVPFDVKLTKKGTYDFTIQPKPGTTLNGWTLEISDTENPMTVANDNDQTLKMAQISVTTGGSPAAKGNLIFRIKRQGANSDWFKEYDVQAL